IVEQTWPIVIDGRFVGVAGVDRSLDAIDRFMSELKPYRTAEFILISHRGRIISATLDASLKTRPLEQTPFAGALESLWKSTRDGVEVGMWTEARARGGDLIYAAARVPTGDWLLVMRVAEAEILEPVWVGLRRVVLLGGLGLGLTLVLLAWLAGSVAKPVGAAARAASRVAGGDLSVCVETGGADETGQLLDAIHRMTLSLSGLIGKVRHSGQAVNAAASRIEGATGAQETVVSDLGSSTTQISAAATEIATTAGELLKTMNDITGLVADTAGLALAGRTGIEGMESVMRGVESGAEAIATRLSVISEGARAVTGVVATMTQVADQTNLLSLNAAIEAVKARDQGAGFGVVAEEIRRLADQTAVAALDIEQRVLHMQASVVEGVDEMRQFGAQVHEAVGAVVRLSGQLEDIIARVQDLLPRFEQVNQGMRSQSAGAEEISMSMRILSGVAHQTTDSITELDATVADLRQAVATLSEEIAFFRVSDQSPAGNG
ncbi:MAG: methyl-accepting chemotaxis protein, partial [Methylococcus sp.]